MNTQCTKPAEFEIKDGPTYDNHTHACREHAGAMLQHGLTSTVYEAPKDCRCCYVGEAARTAGAEEVTVEQRDEIDRMAHAARLLVPQFEADEALTSKPEGETLYRMSKALLVLVAQRGKG